MTDYLTVQMVAERCHVHVKTIERAIRERGLRASKLADRGCWVIHPDDLEAWIDMRANRARHTAGQTPAPVQARPRSGRRTSAAGELRDLLTEDMGRAA